MTLVNDYYFHPVTIETTSVYSKSIVPFVSCLAKNLVCVWWPQGTTVVPSALVPGYGHRECCHYIGLCATL